MAIYKLGKLPARKDKRTFLMRNMVPFDAPDPPAAFDLQAKVSEWGMCLNDQLGCCTCATVAHMTLQMTTYAKLIPTRVPDDCVLRLYSAVTGYNPENPNTDQGANILDVLNYWRNRGIPAKKTLFGLFNISSTTHQILGYAAVDIKNQTEVKQALTVFGGLYIGVELPIYIQDADAWAMPAESVSADDRVPGSWGGHAINVVGYNETGVQVVTWGKTLWMSWDFWNTYVDEAYVVMTNDFFTDATSKTPTGYIMSQLAHDLRLLAS